MRIEAPTGEQGTATFTTSGKVITFAGFYRAYVASSDDPRAEQDDKEKILPKLSRGQQLTVEGLEPTSHTTQPPARYTEASLVKELEARGIGRPSTYASIIQTIQDRGYVWHKGQALVPTFTAFAVIRLLERNLPDLVDYDFTARMEDELDAIARGETEAVPWLHDFYFGVSEAGNGRRQIMRMGLHALVATGEAIEPREASRITIGQTAGGRTGRGAGRSLRPVHPDRGLRSAGLGPRRHAARRAFARTGARDGGESSRRRPLDRRRSRDRQTRLRQGGPLRALRPARRP